MFLLISWRCVRKVVSVIASTSTAASTRTSTPSALRKVSEILPPANTAERSCSLSSGVIRPRLVSGLRAAWSSMRKSARKIGICSRIGRQDANGLVPESL